MCVCVYVLCGDLNLNLLQVLVCVKVAHHMVHPEVQRQFSDSRAVDTSAVFDYYYLDDQFEHST